MMLNFFLQLEHRGAMQWIGEAIPFLIVGSAVLAMLLSILLRYNQRFREFWENYVCEWQLRAYFVVGRKRTQSKK